MTTLVVVLLLLAGWYLLSCWIWPWAACLRCGGNPKRRAPGGRAWRDCRACGGSGKRVRLGRRVFESVRKATK